MWRNSFASSAASAAVRPMPMTLGTVTDIDDSCGAGERRVHRFIHHKQTGPAAKGPLRVTPLQLLDRLAAVVPPPHVYRYREPPEFFRRAAGLSQAAIGN